MKRKSMWDEILHRDHNQEEEKFGNATFEETFDNDALVLSVDSSIESSILDSSVLFYSTSFNELMHNFVAEKFGNVYLVDDEPLDIMRKGDIHVKTTGGYPC